MKVSPILVFRFLVLILILNLGFSLINRAFAQHKPFQMEWNVAERGTIVEFDLDAKNITIEYGDGSTMYWDAIGREGWLYSDPGNYTISIAGGLESISLVPGAISGNKFLRIVQWGDIQWKSMEDMFNGTQVRFNLSQVDSPDLSQVSSLAGMFKDAQFDENLGDWDISTITDMADIFSGSTLSPQNYDATLIGWATQNVQRNVTVGAEGLTFCEGKVARQKLIDEYGWTFVGDKLAEECQEDKTKAFVTKWVTTSSNEEIIIPTTKSGFSYNYSIDWGDGSQESGLRGDATHRYLNPGVYTVSISGVFPGLRMDMSTENNQLKILSIEQWGDIQWREILWAFYKCENLEIRAKDTPDLSMLVNGLIGTFSEAATINSDLNNWDVSKIQFFSRLFEGAKLFNGDLGSWNMSLAKEIHFMFYGAENFNRDISNWDVSMVVNMSQIFKGASSFNQPIGKWNTGKVEYLYGAFENAVSFDKSLADWDISKVTKMDRIFNGSGMSQANYDATLIGWAAQEVQRNVTVGADGLTFCEGKAARQKLIDEYGWTFVGDQLADDCVDTSELGEPFILSYVYNRYAAYDTNDGEGGGAIYIGPYGDDFFANWDAYIYGQDPNYWTGDRVEYFEENSDLLNGYFYCCSDVSIAISRGMKSLDLSSWNSSNPFIISAIHQWGDIEWESVEGLFKGITPAHSPVDQFNLNFSGTDSPNLSKVTSTKDMFNGTRFSSDFSSWDVSSIENMSGMFQNSNLNQNIGSWDISNVTDMTDIFSGSSLSQANYDATLIGWATQEVQRNVTVGAEGLTFCEGKAARQKLIDEYGWTFVGDKLAEECQDIDPGAFVTIWETTGLTEGIYIPTADPNFAYNYTVDWGDGTVEEGLTGRAAHRYFNPGRYTVSITGQFPKTWFYISSTENKAKLMEVKQWGSMKWLDMSQAFYETGNLEISATDSPDLSEAFTTIAAFLSAGLTTPDLNSWNVSTIENFEQMFYNAESFNGKIDQWDMSNALNVSHMFYSADIFNQDISRWDMSSVNNISYMFAETDLFNQPIGNWDFENLQYLNNVFENATSFDQSLANWNISKAISMEGIFDGSGMSQENYDATLIGWAAQNVQWDVVVGAEGLTFCAGKAARQKLIDEYRWKFVGDLEAADCKDLITGITFEDATFTYDGTLKTIKISGDLPDGVTVTYEDNTRTEVGSQTTTAYLDGGENYEDLTLTATLTIVEGEAPNATTSDIQVESWEICAGEIVPLEASSTTVANPVFTFYLDADLTQMIESSEIEVFQDTQVYVTVKGDGVNENLPGEAAIIDIKVNLVEAPVFLESSQEFCSENTPTLDDFVVEPITPGASMEYYASLESTEPLAWNTPLENKTYYAEVYDAVKGCGSARVPITAVLKTCEQEPGEKLPIEGITFTDATFTYDGTEKSIQLSGNLPAGVTVTYENNTRTEIGSQTATAKLDGGENYQNLTLTATLTIVEGDVPTAKASDIQVTELEVCLGEILDLTASSTTVTNPIFTFYLDEQLTQKIEDDKIQILGDTQIFVTIKGSGIDENLPGEAAVWQIVVRSVEPPVFSLFTQEFCAEDEATLAQVVVQGVGEEEQLNYYESEDASEPLAMSALLESKTYFAEKVDLFSGCSSERVPVVVDVTTCQQESINFSISKNADVSTVLPGGQITYTITIQNDSDQSTGQLTVSDPLNEFLTFISASHNGQLLGENEVTWIIENLESGASIQLNLLAEVSLDAPVAQVISNVAEGKLVDDPEQVKSSNTVEVLVDGVAQTGVSIQKTQSVNGEISPGESIEYQITVTNTGESPAYDLVIEDVFPQELVLTSASPGAEVQSSKVTWYLEELAAGQSVSFTLSFDVLGEQGSLINFASVRGENFPAVSDQTDPVAIKEILSPDLIIYLESAPKMVLKGKEYQVKIHVVNTGSVSSGPLAVDHYFSDLVGYEGASSEVGDISYDSSNKYLTWGIEEISPGDTLELILELKATEDGLVENFFHVYSDTPDPDYSNNELVFTINQSELRIPNVFTPNGDGINESWRIEQLNELFASNQLVVFDRMGKTVFSTENYQNDWSGTGLSRGTYFYELATMDFEGNSYQFSGFITLIY
ncbi:BspA family leucine-rich repeat surface protein [Algoriphagus sp. AGSA1]|uniref:BspA family leucine-rich repeat surface protein n=1 Tax=Algoriphagus sp. AGSA1 TaxID=2907213 RepID=UPI001F4145D9|nr:BspA family leucine-rich repeat surface protein [Algoriphagus sp. AGSA1]MCE7053620.1 BspA family leucine-rich repeat surface protein [Algoriphagus sp. AGSA1]